MPSSGGTASHTYAARIGDGNDKPSVEWWDRTMGQLILRKFFEPVSENARGTLVAQRQISGAVGFSKINGLRYRPCVDIAGVTGSIPVAPTILSL